jgi:hypothetical protein
VTVLFCDLTGSTALGESTHPEARAALEEALDCYGRKKNLAMVERVRPRLGALQADISKSSRA